MSLIFLVIMTIVALAGMNSAILESLMARNSLEQTDALADAEFVLDKGEADIEAVVTDGATLDFSADDHYYQSGTAGVDPSALDWSGFTHKTESTSSYSGAYIVEYAGDRELPGESAAWGDEAAAGSYIHVFLNSAQSEKGKGAKRTVQTVYVTLESP